MLPYGNGRKPMTEPVPQPQRPDTPSLWSRALELIAYPVGGVLGYYTFDSSVRHEFYGNLAKDKVFEDLQRKSTQETVKILDRALVDKTIHAATEKAIISEN